MKKFSYEARDQAANKIVKATVQADSEHAAAKLLVDQGFSPLKLREIGEGSNPLARLSSRITTKDKIVFTRQLATLIGAGLPLTQSLRTIIEQTQNKQLRGVVEEVLASVEAGKSLSDSFSKRTDIFGPIFIALVKAGEASGTLDESLRRVATQQEKDAAVMSKIRGALMYPLIVLVVIFGVLAFMVFTVVPQVSTLYDDLNKELPLLTRILVDGSAFLIQWWWVILIALVIAGYFFVQYLRTESGIAFKDNFKLNVPVFKGMFRKLYMARFTRTGQTLLSTGVAMLDMLKITSEAINNTVIEKSIDRAASKVKGGKALSESLQPEDYILSLVPQMIKIGEQSGRIDEMMGKTAQVYEDELDEEIRAISTMIEPILMVFLAVVAGGMVGAILFPIYNLVNGIGV